MKVLLAIDSSDFSETVVKEVAAYQWPAGSFFIVLTVIDLFALTSSVGYVNAFMKNENDAALALVESVSKGLAGRGIEALTQVVEGQPATSIVEQATIWNADFVLLGSHGHGGVARFLLGSVAKEVVRNAPCSVKIIRRGNEEASGKRVLLCTDGSSCSEAAARSVAERLWPSGTLVRIVSVVEQTIPAIDPLYASGDVIERMLLESRRQCEQAIGAAYKIVAAAGLPATTAVLAGSPKWGIIDDAKEWNADLIVLGSHGRRGMTRALLGSVSESVAMNAPCSVEVIRSPGSRKGMR